MRQASIVEEKVAAMTLATSRRDDAQADASQGEQPSTRSRSRRRREQRRRAASRKQRAEGSAANSDADEEFLSATDGRTGDVHDSAGTRSRQPERGDAVRQPVICTATDATVTSPRSIPLLPVHPEESPSDVRAARRRRTTQPEGCARALFGRE